MVKAALTRSFLKRFANDVTSISKAAPLSSLVSATGGFLPRSLCDKIKHIAKNIMRCLVAATRVRTGLYHRIGGFVLETSIAKNGHMGSSRTLTTTKK